MWYRTFAMTTLDVWRGKYPYTSANFSKHAERAV